MNLPVVLPVLIPLLAGLFVFPLCFYFYRLGYGASAVLGGLVGSFSPAYYGAGDDPRLFSCSGLGAHAHLDPCRVLALGAGARHGHGPWSRPYISAIGHGLDLAG